MLTANIAVIAIAKMNSLQTGMTMLHPSMSRSALSALRRKNLNADKFTNRKLRRGRLPRIMSTPRMPMQLRKPIREMMPFLKSRLLRKKITISIRMLMILSELLGRRQMLRWRPPRRKLHLKSKMLMKPLPMLRQKLRKRWQLPMQLMWAKTKQLTKRSSQLMRLLIPRLPLLGRLNKIENKLS